MTQVDSPVVGTKNPLDAAQKIVAVLHGMNKDDQSLAFQFAMQTLRISVQTPHVLPTPTHSQVPILNAPVAPSGIGHSTDIKAFTAAKAPKSHQQFAAVVAYFYQFEAPASQRRNSIDAPTMKDAARLVVWGQVKDWNMTLNNATRAGYLDRAERGAFKLSSVGENLVAITLPGTATIGAGNGGGAFKKAVKKKATAGKTTKKVR